MQLAQGYKPEPSWVSNGSQLGPPLNFVHNFFHYALKTEKYSYPIFTWCSQSKKLDSPCTSFLPLFPCSGQALLPWSSATALGSALSQNWAISVLRKRVLMQNHRLEPFPTQPVKHPCSLLPLCCCTTLHCFAVSCFSFSLFFEGDGHHHISLPLVHVAPLTWHAWPLLAPAKYWQTPVLLKPWTNITILGEPSLLL